MNKSILAVQHADGTKEAVCPKCKQKMEQVDLGVSQSIQNGQLVESDLGFVWHCKSCGYMEDE